MDTSSPLIILNSVVEYEDNFVSIMQVKGETPKLKIQFWNLDSKMLKLNQTDCVQIFFTISNLKHLLSDQNDFSFFKSWVYKSQSFAPLTLL